MGLGESYWLRVRGRGLGLGVRLLIELSAFGGCGEHDRETLMYDFGTFRRYGENTWKFIFLTTSKMCD